MEMNLSRLPISFKPESNDRLQDWEKLEDGQKMLIHHYNK